MLSDNADLLPGVESGKYAVAINHIALTVELQDRFDFSDVYKETPELAIPFQRGNPASKSSLDKALHQVKALTQKWFAGDAPVGKVQ